MGLQSTILPLEIHPDVTGVLRDPWNEFSNKVGDSKTPTSVLYNISHVNQLWWVSSTNIWRNQDMLRCPSRRWLWRVTREKPIQPQVSLGTSEGLSNVNKIVFRVPSITCDFCHLHQAAPQMQQNKNPCPPGCVIEKQRGYRSRQGQAGKWTDTKLGEFRELSSHRTSFGEPSCGRTHYEGIRTYEEEQLFHGAFGLGRDTVVERNRKQRVLMGPKDGKQNSIVLQWKGPSPTPWHRYDQI